MLPAILVFAATYVLMISFGKYRTWFALASGLIFVVTGMLPMSNIIPSLDFNVLLMIGGTMGLVQLFIDSHMPERMADMIMAKVPNVQWAAVCLSLFAAIGLLIVASFLPFDMPDEINGIICCTLLVIGLIYNYARKKNMDAIQLKETVSFFAVS